MRIRFYGRYSTDGQREASIEDQYRVCSRHDLAMKYSINMRYEDRAISGGRDDRPDYIRMLGDAKAGAFDVLLVEDLSRLDRSGQTKQIVKRLKHWNVRVIGVSEGFDSDSKSYKMHVSFAEMKNEAFIDDLREKTHRGLYGKAEKGHNAGGRSYGYKHVLIEDPIRKDPHGRPEIAAVNREIDPEQAAVIVQIYEWYVSGRSALWIAVELNREGIPAPRSGSWCRTTIYGDRRSGVGILNNPLYNGKYIWNRTTWIRDPDNKKIRKRIERPAHEWVTTDAPHLKIINDDLWSRAQACMASRRNESMSRAKAGKNTGGRSPRYLLSGLLQCKECGSNFTMVNARSYGCACAKERGTCSNHGLVKREKLEDVILSSIKENMLSADVVAHYRKCTAQYLADYKRSIESDATKPRLAQLNREIENMIAAIKAGQYSASLSAALAAAERERDQLNKPRTAKADIADILPHADALYREMVENLGQCPTEDIADTREQIKQLIGDSIMLYPQNNNMFAEYSINYDSLLSQVTGLSKTRVAGARFGRILHTVQVA